MISISYIIAFYVFVLLCCTIQSGTCSKCSESALNQMQSDIDLSEILESDGFYNIIQSISSFLINFIKNYFPNVTKILLFLVNWAT
ncbi:hypothetical protein FQR65_LT08857 [Abscondita terminalis]|nr:hypothetical protein FQR65_LT08857 [Abscondita terminalis]